jgi:DnaD/phage-associated family protein
MESGGGFPRGARYTPVPGAVLGALLEEIGSLAELKCTLRIMGLVHQRRSQRVWLDQAELLADPVLLKGLVDEPGGAAKAIRRGIDQAAERGTLLRANGPGQEESRALLFLNDEQGRRALASLCQPATPPGPVDWPEGDEESPTRSSIFSLYEENIGTVSPLLAEALQEAETAYPWSWIEDAFREAVGRNRRSWRYIEAILNRWETEGKDNGEPGRYPQKDDPREFLREHIRRRGHLAG